MRYIDGYLIPVPKARREDYEAMAKFAAPIFIEHGAIEVSENWGDDLIKGESTDFYMAVKAGAEECVVFSWIIWPDKATRDAGNKSAMEDERYKQWEDVDVFDGKRMIYSGFSNILTAKA